ncbi:uncharacterized protein VB005_09366 [Metarhizium brunneum]
MAQWLSSTLRLPAVITFQAFTAALLSAILVLAILSQKNKGFVQISNFTIKPLSGFDISWNLGLLWTTLPSFVFTIYGRYWDSLAQALADQQPFVELCRPDGASSAKTIFLDYKGYSVLCRWRKAFKNGHICIGSSLLVSLVLSTTVGPLAARLFVQDVRKSSQEKDVIYNSSIDLSGINANSDWVSVFNNVAAIRLYNGNPLPWTDAERAFVPFYLDPKSDRGGSNSTVLSLTANTTAYAAYLDCSALSNYTMSLQGYTVTVTATDRGCGISQDFAVPSAQFVHFKTSSDICSAESSFSRLVFTYGVFSSSSPKLLRDVSVISCIANYTVTPGRLTIAPGSSPSSATNLSFAPEGTSDDTRPVYWRNIEDGILLPVFVNNNVKWSTSVFGSLVLYYATKVLGGVATNLSTSQLLESVSNMFTASYSTAVVQLATSTGPITQPRTATGIAVIAQTKLFVVLWVAITIMSYMLIVLGASAWALAYVRKHRSMLQEEPRGLVSAAGLLSGSCLMNAAAKAKAHKDYNGKFREFAEQRPGLLGQEPHVRWHASQDDALRPLITTRYDKSAWSRSRVPRLPTRNSNANRIGQFQPSSRWHRWNSRYTTI